MGGGGGMFDETNTFLNPSPPKNFSFFTLPLGIPQTKQSSTPGYSTKLC